MLECTRLLLLIRYILVGLCHSLAHTFHSFGIRGYNAAISAYLILLSLNVRGWPL